MLLPSIGENHSHAFDMKHSMRATSNRKRIPKQQFVESIIMLTNMTSVQRLDLVLLFTNVNEN